jgi:hypothetical protein
MTQFIQLAFRSVKKYLQFLICEEMQKIWFLHQEIHICWEVRCNGIQNQFYSFQTTISILFLTLPYTYFMPNIMRTTYFLCLMEEQATQLGCDEC